MNSMFSTQPWRLHTECTVESRPSGWWSMWRHGPLHRLLPRPCLVFFSPCRVRFSRNPRVMDAPRPKKPGLLLVWFSVSKEFYINCLFPSIGIIQLLLSKNRSFIFTSLSLDVGTFIFHRLSVDFRSKSPIVVFPRPISHFVPLFSYLRLGHGTS